MKQIIYIILLSFAPLLFSCEKEVRNSNPDNFIPASEEYSLVAYDWKKQPDDSYINTFHGFLRTNTTHTTMNVYVISSGYELQINQGPITFFAGTLQSMSDGEDLQIIYRPYVLNTTLPFETLNIKVIFK